MIKYEKQILNALLDKYEKGKSFIGTNQVTQHFTIKPESLFPKYKDDSEFELYCAVNESIDHLEKQGYIVLGTSSFSSEYEPFSKAIQTAKEKGATVVILNSDVSGTRTKTNTVAIPQTNTTYHHGYVNSWNSPYSASYSGVSTTHSTQYYSYNYNVTVFNQVAYFLAKKI